MEDQQIRAAANMVIKSVDESARRLVHLDAFSAKSSTARKRRGMSVAGFNTNERLQDMATRVSIHMHIV